MPSKGLLWGILLCVFGSAVCTGHKRSKVIVTAEKRQALLFRLNNVKHSLLRVKKHAMHGGLRSQVLQLHHDFRQKDKKGGLTAQDIHRLHAQSARIQCKINCAVSGKSRKLKK